MHNICYAPLTLFPEFNYRSSNGQGNITYSICLCVRLDEQEFWEHSGPHRELPCVKSLWESKRGALNSLMLRCVSVVRYTIS